MITCPCQAEASLPEIPCVRCAERFGQIQKVALQRLTADDGTKNGFPKSGGNDTITDLANWQSAMTAADSTKIVISPYKIIYSAAICSMVAHRSSAVTVRHTIQATPMQPMHELTASERPAISHKRNVSRATRHTQGSIAHAVLFFCVY